MSKNSQPITGRFAAAFANYLFADSQFADYPRLSVRVPLNCGMWKVKCGMYPAEICCGMVCGMLAEL